MTVADLGSARPPQGRLPGTDADLRVRGSKYVLVQRSSGREVPLDYALGSGKQGMTFVKVEAGPALLEMRKSYIPRSRSWYTTPGQEPYDEMPEGVGITHKGAIATKCILCHAVTLSPSSLRPEPQFMGVGCESCHGPGSAHIAAVNNHRQDGLQIVSLRGAGGEEMNRVCGSCHRTAESLAMTANATSQTSRFMPYGLSLSRCFRESGDRLTCITCHDPHTDASRDPKAYEAACLTCHSGSAPPSIGTAGGAGTPRGVACPVNPRSGCIPCHMPARKVFHANPVPIAMADHWIKINRDAAPANR
jgi:hypothetical protein